MLVLPGNLLSHTRLMEVRPCLDKECPAKVCLVKGCLDRECLDMVCLVRAMARCQEAQVGMAVDNQLKLVDGTRVSLLRATATDTRTTRARNISSWN